MFKTSLNKISNLTFKLSLWSLLKSYPRYQPVYIKGKLQYNNDRNCIDRWNLIKKEINESNSKSMLDLGCAEGFYVLQAAKELGCMSVGVDADARRLGIASLQMILERIMPAGFILANINEKTIDDLPTYDTVIFMSVMHHMMYTLGEEHCRIILKKIKEKTKKVLIFEMGQSNETKNHWAKLLPNMGSEPHLWIQNFLLSAGFSQVTKIGESDSYYKDQNRAIFRAIP